MFLRTMKCWGILFCKTDFEFKLFCFQKRESKKAKKEEVNVTIPAPDNDSLASLDSSRAASPQSEVRVSVAVDKRGFQPASVAQ